MSVETVMKNPNTYFGSLTDLYEEESLTKDQKINILCQWRYDAIELEAAEEESMGGGPPSNLHEILEALRCLKSNSDSEHSSIIKQRGYN